MASDTDISYIDYEAFLDPDFSSTAFANTLVLSTNNASDTPLDLSTPLSKVLFDAQEIDTHIERLTSKNALPLLTHTQRQTNASANVTREIDSQVRSLNDGYKRLEREILVRYETAKEVEDVAARLVATLRLGRAVGRCLQLGRQLEMQMSEVVGGSRSGAQQLPKGDPKALLRCVNTILSLRELFALNEEGQEGYGLETIVVIRDLQGSLITPIERSALSKAQQYVKDYANTSSPSAVSIFAQAADAQVKLSVGAQSLYLLSPVGRLDSKREHWEPELLLQAMQDYVKSTLITSLSSLAKALAALPTLDRVLAEISSRCQNLLLFESLLAATEPPTHPLLPPLFKSPPNLLQLLLASLETGSVASFFWRSLANALTTKVQEIMIKGGVSARTLRSNKNSVKDSIRDCVINAGQAPPGVNKKDPWTRSWDREIAVMVGCIAGPLGR